MIRKTCCGFQDTLKDNPRDQQTPVQEGQKEQEVGMPLCGSLGPAAQDWLQKAVVYEGAQGQGKES